MSEDIERRKRLHTLIEEYTATNLGRKGLVTGWILAVTTSRFDDEGDQVYSYDYSCGPGTDLVRAVGLLRACSLTMENNILGGNEFSQQEGNNPDE